ncbi:MAG: hypothetical protein LC797_22675 [Chloroflexi bacterium]|nr:hypothetical protein [Chloroflexota bacterium]
MRRLVLGLSLHTVVLALCAAPTAQAATLFDMGPSRIEAANVPMNRLPTWVQVTNSSAPLYATDSPGVAMQVASDPAAPIRPTRTSSSR